jgi:hypothetical protein
LRHVLAPPYFKNKAKRWRFPAKYSNPFFKLFILDSIHLFAKYIVLKTFFVVKNFRKNLHHQPEPNLLLVDGWVKLYLYKYMQFLNYLHHKYKHLKEISNERIDLFHSLLRDNLKRKH